LSASSLDAGQTVLTIFRSLALAAKSETFTILNSAIGIHKVGTISVRGTARLAHVICAKEVALALRIFKARNTPAQILGTVGSVLGAIRLIGAGDIGTRAIREADFISRAVAVSVCRVAGDACTLKVVAEVGAVALADLTEVSTVAVRGAA
jgi:hypothetical protein